MRIESDRAHMWNMRRRRKRPPVSPRDFQKAVGLLEDAAAIVAAEQARMRRADEYAVLHGGRCGDRPNLLFARERGSYVDPGAAAVSRSGEGALAADLLSRASVDEIGIGGVLRHAPHGRRIGKHHQ